MKKLLLLGCLVLGALSAFTAKTPNVVLIYVDDLGFGDLSCYGATKVQTPNIDRLAKEGRQFLDAHSPSAVCTPSRYGVMTGEYPFRQGTEGSWGPLGHTKGLIIDTKKLTLGRLFDEAGYATAAIGKWHLGFGEKSTDYNKPLRPGPLELGFDYYFGIATNNSANPYVYLENDRVYGWDPKDPLTSKKGELPYPYDEVGLMQINRFGGAKKAHALYDNRMTGTILSEKAVKWIRDNRKKPFFMYYAPPQIHHPFTPHQRFVGTSQAGMYGDFIHELDWMVGEVLNTLDELELAEDTLVLFTSDNGGMYNLGGKQAFAAGHKQNGKLLGFKFGVWEGGHRVPFLARWPGRIKAGSTSRQLYSSVDTLASLASLLGRKLKEGEGLDSIDQIDTILKKPAKPARDQLVLLPREEDCIGFRQDEWVYIISQGDGSGGIGTSQRGGPWAIAHTKSKNSDVAPDGTIRPDAPKAQLYNLKKDPYQTTNVISEHPHIAAKLKKQLQDLVNSKSTRN
ncbi:MAG: arylsulfatase [Puniceicoccaceae bacterium]